ncbi:hypothetical protein [Streptomyces sp. NPDC040750]|uniref:hypothetical protein n=1 Tax=Streptomyces sp. NPDC040750 TaxID=3154491 RepID=UPI003410E648
MGSGQDGDGLAEGRPDDGSSDRLVDALYARGDEPRIHTRLNVFHEAGADHVAL